MKKLNTYLLGLLLLFGACNEVVDEEKPTAIIEFPAENELVATNQNLRLVATVTDDTGLLQYKVTLDGVDEQNGIAADSTISFIIVDGVEGNEKALYLDETFELPDSTFNGTYRLTLACVDIDGKQSVTDTVTFEIRNSTDFTPPVINVGGPTLDTMTIGNGFTPFGEITDERDLTYATIFIGRTNNSDTIHWFDFPAIQNNLVSFATGQTFWVVDSTWSQGDYHVYCTAWDGYSGVSSSIPFHVKY